MVEREFGTFFVPGPTEIRPEILAQLTRPMMVHRGREFEAMFARIEAGLRDVLLTARPVYVGATSATGFMEMAIRNVREGAILALVNGGFSERFAAVAESCEREVDRVTVPWGETFDLNVVESALRRRGYAALTTRRRLLASSPTYAPWRSSRTDTARWRSSTASPAPAAPS